MNVRLPFLISLTIRMEEMTVQTMTTAIPAKKMRVIGSVQEKLSVAASVAVSADA